MKKLILCLGLLLCSCVSDQDAYGALERAGFDKVKLTGHRWFSCTRDQWYSQGFSAVDGKSKPITGVVCCSWIGCGVQVD